MHIFLQWALMEAASDHLYKSNLPDKMMQK